MHFPKRILLSLIFCSPYTCLSSLVALKILSLSLILSNLIIMFIGSFLHSLCLSLLNFLDLNLLLRSRQNLVLLLWLAGRPEPTLSLEIPTLHHWGQSLPCSLPNALGILRLSHLLVGISSIPDPVWATLILLVVLYPASHSFLTLYTYQVFTEYSKETLCRSPEFSLCSSLLSGTLSSKLWLSWSLGLRETASLCVDSSCAAAWNRLPAASSGKYSTHLLHFPLLTNHCPLWPHVLYLENCCFIHFLCFLFALGGG